MALLSGAKMAAKEYNVNLTIWAPKDESDYEEQNQLIEKAIEKNHRLFCFRHQITQKQHLWQRR